MRKFIIKRIIMSIFILFFVAFIIYALLRCLPSSYVENMAQQLSMAPGAKSYEEWIAQLNAQYGLDKNIVLGFFTWLGDAVRGTEMGEVDEIVITGDGFFRIHLEKDPGANTELRCPADLPADVMARVRDAGRTVYEALGCSGFARVDLFVTPEGEVVFNEVNSTPGLTYYSRFPQMMRVAGRELGAVLAELIDAELAR